jgi:hypothetical protein
MTNADRKQFGVLMGVLCAAFGREAGEPTVQAFWFALGDLDIDALSRAVAEYLRTGKRFPAPADIRELAAGTGDDAANTAWEQVLRLARNSRSAQHPDPIAEAVVKQLGGWLVLGQKDAEQLATWTRKEFLALYADELARERRVALPGRSVRALPA